MEPLRLIPDYYERVWGGQRLKPAHPPVGEAWIIHESNRIASGPWREQSLAAVVEAQGERLLGRRALAQTGARFPLLIKLLDTADWLSVQVHPNDDQALRLEGPGQFGKTEAWHILDAAPDAELICGLQPGTTMERFSAAVRAGMVADLMQHLPVRADDTIFIPAGTIHALGPGLLLYEVQQTSDITYRVYDWGRPQSAGRQLHLEQSLTVTEPALGGELQPRPVPDQTRQRLVGCNYFHLDRLSFSAGAVTLAPAGKTFHALTVTAGDATVSGPGWRETLRRFESLVVPAESSDYQITGTDDAHVLLASVPAT